MPQEGSGSLAIQPFGCTPWCSTDAPVVVWLAVQHFPSHDDWQPYFLQFLSGGFSICYGLISEEIDNGYSYRTETTVLMKLFI